MASPDWEWIAPIATAGLAMLGTVATALVRIIYKLGRQDEQIEWMGRALETIGKRTDSLMPPRRKLMTFSNEKGKDPFR